MEARTRLTRIQKVFDAIEVRAPKFFHSGVIQACLGVRQCQDGENRSKNSIVQKAKPSLIN